MRITKFERSEDGYLTARVTLENGRTFPVHRRYGSWMTGEHGDQKGGLREIPKPVAMALASKAASFEKAERKLVMA